MIQISYFGSSFEAKCGAYMRWVGLTQAVDAYVDGLLPMMVTAFHSKQTLLQIHKPLPHLKLIHYKKILLHTAGMNVALEAKMSGKMFIFGCLFDILVLALSSHSLACSVIFIPIICTSDYVAKHRHLWSGLFCPIRNLRQIFQSLPPFIDILLLLLFFMVIFAILGKNINLTLLLILLECCNRSEYSVYYQSIWLPFCLFQVSASSLQTLLTRYV